ncbi:MAG: hypothetical protein FJX45_03020 [Alphaproteobacteria bacterium]|nr:hypothetical protein [Alphaproteobacteria bacterium]MBM3651473.1 hypothetical protein [Alphaproteobacteria bacterium]
MAVSLRDHRGAPPRDNIETRARYAWHDIEADWRVASPRPSGPRRQSHAIDSDRNFERVERFFCYGAAALVIVGTAIVVVSAFWGELPKNVDSADSLTPQRIASSGAAGAATSHAPLANARSHEQPVSIVAGPVEPAPTHERAAAALESESAPIAQASEAVAPSAANFDPEPDALNGEIAGRRGTARSGAEDGAPDAAKSESAAPEALTRKCHVRISGRVLEDGSCQISRKGGAVTFRTSGQTLTLSPVKGKTWSAVLAGKTLGNVYKSGSCWASKNIYICDRGAL